MQPSTITQQPTIENLYQQQSMMNTNQLLFSTTVNQQQYTQQQYAQQQYAQQQAVGGFATGTANSLLGAPITAQTAATLPFNTGLGLNQMFATGVPNAGFATGISAINAPSFPVTMNTGMGNPSANTSAANNTVNPNFQIGAGFQTGQINLNQLYQTGVQQQPSAFADLTSMTTSSQQQHAGMMFQTTTNPTATTIGSTFNTTVPSATNKDLFDLL